MFLDIFLCRKCLNFEQALSLSQRKLCWKKLFGHLETLLAIQLPVLDNIKNNFFQWQIGK